MAYILERTCEPSLSFDSKEAALKAATDYTFDSGYLATVCHKGLVVLTSKVTHGQVVICMFAYCPAKSTKVDDGNRCVSNGAAEVLALMTPNGS